MHANEYKHLYRTHQWKKTSKQFRLAHPFCEFCGKPAQIVDHKKPHRGNPQLFFSMMNLQSLCKACHDSAKYRIELGQVPGKDFVVNNEAEEDGLPASPNHPWNK